MRLSARCQYALRALFDLAYHADANAAAGRAIPVQVKDIARRQDAPARYLEQILQFLKKEGFVTARRGPTGGYLLAREPSDITVGDVVRATEGTVEALFSLEQAASANGAGAQPGGRAAAAPSRRRRTPDTSAEPAIEEAWRHVADEMARALDSVTIADLCVRAEALGVRQGDDRTNMYFI